MGKADDRRGEPSATRKKNCTSYLRLFSRKSLLFVCFPQEQYCISGYLSGFHTYRHKTLSLGCVRFSDVFIVDKNQVWDPAASHGRQSRRRLLYQRQGIHGKQWGLPHGPHCLRSLPSTELASPFMYCRSETRRLTGDSRTTHLYVSFQSGGSLHGDSKQIHVNFHKEFVSWIVFSGKCNLNN
jgi:hypothetical protein